MRLSKIKLAGFKSFVDPTTLPLTTNRTAVVGPNGCGKSNVIDAVRWVMGESSAKQLRGESATDVIFNGSNSRKPVSQASVELVFDNSDRTLTGEYAGYNEIALKRAVGRDGSSGYFLNGSKCRRRDIVDIFLGTGLGPRSYAIIEQGTISRLIEAKPDELRIFLEEAAGISKYKERRRETENRIRHTEENLARLDDIRQELEKQLDRLHRQAQTAEKYKTLKQDERRLRGELLALRLRDLTNMVEQGEARIRDHQTKVESAIADLRAIETEIEAVRQTQNEAQDGFNQIQGRYYGIGSDVSRVEQEIRHLKELRETRERELGEAERAVGEMRSHIKRDRERLETANRLLTELEPQKAQTAETEDSSARLLSAVETELQSWQAEWESFNSEASEAQQSASVEQARIDAMSSQIKDREARIERLNAELDRLNAQTESGDDAADEERLATLASEQLQHERELGKQRQGLESLREESDRCGQSLNQLRDQLQRAKGRLSSLEALQEAALGKADASMEAWLKAQGLDSAKRLAECLDVADGWQVAVEAALDHVIEAVVVDDVSALAGKLVGLKNGGIALVDAQGKAKVASGSLANKVESSVDVSALLGHVLTIESLEQALDARQKLQGQQCYVTRQGWLIGQNWLRRDDRSENDAGVLAREQEIRELGREIKSLEKAEQSQAAQQQQLKDGREKLRQEREEMQRMANDKLRAHADLKAALESRRARNKARQERRDAATREVEELNSKISDDRNTLGIASKRLEVASERVALLTAERDARLQQREALNSRVREARDQRQAQRDAAHLLAMQIETQRSAKANLEENLDRMKGQIGQLEIRFSDLQEKLSPGDNPEQEKQDKLEGLLAQQRSVQQELGEARKAFEAVESQLREKQEARQLAEQGVEQARGSLDAERLQQQEAKTRTETLREQLREEQYDPEQLLKALADKPEEEIPDLQYAEEQLQALQRRIERLGPINLAAIDEHKQESERKAYLDAQHADLTQALQTLTDAIGKIDRETRSRFKDTFEKVDKGLQELFPRLFGGGQAYLELTGDDLLSTGVNIMAQPPGKRNASIQLLSGGEKALTAVALVFSIFQLNPAPFCMLDEVDAPLDDANVGRFSAMVKEMSDQVQFIFITHNKVTMEMSQHMCGVTMQEAGVSRLVAVDLDEALKLAG